MNRNYGMFGLALAGEASPGVDFAASASSNGIDAAVSNEPIRVTNGARDTTVGRYVSSMEANADVTTLAFPEQVGMMLFAALGTDDVEAVTGQTGYYTHTITMGETLPAVDFFQQVGSSSAAMQKLEGAKVSTLNISAEGVTPPAIAMSLVGKAAKWLATTTWSGPGDDLDEWFTSAGAEVKMVLNGSTPTTPPAYISLNSIEIGIENPLSPSSKFGTVEASEVVEGACSVSVNLSGTTSDTEVYRIVKTGSASGTSVSGAILTGALEITFPHVSDAKQKLVAHVPAIPWNCDALGVDVEGGPFDLTLSTDGAIAVDGSSVWFELVNKRADGYDE